MPEANGLKVVSVVTKLYKDLNAKRMISTQLVMPEFVFLSAHLENPDFVDICKEAGVSSFYQKPLSEDNLKGIIRKIRR